ncbi:MAG: hypothetical protein M1821_001242 [Bathelium mastoideum]|nr:MAG: hypothetical protein M1821_001242 [Bathelium mastoideum]
MVGEGKSHENETYDDMTTSAAVENAGDETKPRHSQMSAGGVTDVSRDENSGKDQPPDGLDDKDDATSSSSPSRQVNVSDFIQKLEPFIPPKLTDEMRELLENNADRLQPKKKAHIKPPPPPPPPPPPLFIWSLEIERNSMQEWAKKDTFLRKVPTPIIKAYYSNRHDVSAAIGGPAQTESSEIGDEQKIGLDVGGDSKSLQRIAIYSDILGTELENICSGSYLTDPMILAPPYKLLVRFLPSIRSRLNELKRELQTKTDQQAGNPQLSSDSKVQNIMEEAKSCSTKQREDGVNDDTKSSVEQDLPAPSSDPEFGLLSVRISHIQCLCDFIQEELCETIELRAKIANGTLHNISFENLWHLVEPGDIIVSKNHGYDQLYKVYSVTGGQIRRRPRTSDELRELERQKQNILLPTPLNPFEDGYDFDYEGSSPGTWTPFRVDCYMLAYNGVHIRPVEECKKIKRYVGERRISELPLYPVRFHPEKEELLQKMEERGKKFLACSGHKSYEGMTLGMSRDESREEIESDVYIDFVEYDRIHQKRNYSVGRLLRSTQDLSEVQEHFAGHDMLYLSGHEVDQRLADDFMAANHTLLERVEVKEFDNSPDNLRLMPHTVVGYAFKLRQWFKLDIDLVKDIDKASPEAERFAFEDLVIPERYRKLLVALVENHVSGKQRREQKLKAKELSVMTQIDLVRSKGLGLIILLHGPPGSGKTSTAETIAAYTKRPLYSITCGDIGLEPATVEHSLSQHTRLADKWGCVLLLDEADVFLMQRNWENTQRNALISVFLRQLEYYPGILFLTTNRPGVLDEAFKSRIHIALKYPKIDLESTKAIWRNVMNRLERDNQKSVIKVQFNREVLLEFAESHYQRREKDGLEWNGRQIRNAFQTALALGHHDRLTILRENNLTEQQAVASGKKKWTTVKLTKANFRNIAKIAREFEDYIEQLRGKDSDIARQTEVRDDEYDIDIPRARKEYPTTSYANTSVRQGKSKASSANSTVLKSKRKTQVESDVEDEGEEEDEEDGEDEDEDQEEEED